MFDVELNENQHRLQLIHRQNSVDTQRTVKLTIVSNTCRPIVHIALTT